MPLSLFWAALKGSFLHSLMISGWNTRKMFTMLPSVFHGSCILELQKRKFAFEKEKYDKSPRIAGLFLSGLKISAVIF